MIKISYINSLINILLIILIFLFPIKIFIKNIIPPLIVVLWLIEGNFKYKWEILKKSKIFWILVIMLIIMFLSAVFSHYYTQGEYPHQFKNVFDFLFRRYFLYFMLIPVMITDLQIITIQKMFKAFVLGMFVSEVMSYLIFFKVIPGDPNDPTPFLSHSFYTPLLAFTIILLIDLFIKEQNKFIKIFYLLFSFTATANLFINGGRSGQFIFLVILILYFWIKFKKYKKYLLLLLLFIPLVYYLAYNFSPVFKSRVNQSISTIKIYKYNKKRFYNTSFGNRVFMWKIVLEDYLHSLTLKKLLLGVGYGESRKDYFDYLNKSGERKWVYSYPITKRVHFHNQYVTFLYNGGVILVLLYLYVFYLLFKENFYEYNIEAKVFAIIYLLLSFTEDTLYRAYGVLFFVLFTGMFFAYKRLKLSNQ